MAPTTPTPVRRDRPEAATLASGVVPPGLYTLDSLETIVDSSPETWFTVDMETTEYPKETKVTGSGGRPRTVWVCEHTGHWHGSYSQAVKCDTRWNEAKAKRDAK